MRLNQDFTTLEKVEIHEIIHPLKKPYFLPFVTLYEFRSIEVTMWINRKKYVSEIVPLEGYNDESYEEILDFLIKWSKEISSKDSIFDLREKESNKIKFKPFSVSPILTAIDTYLLEEKLNHLSDKHISFVIPFSIDSFDPSNLSSEHEYKFKLNSDLDGCIEILNIWNSRDDLKPLRLDANQTFSYDEAIYFANKISKYKLQNTFSYLEQPFKSNSWEHYSHFLNKNPNFPIMLDESIVTNNDIIKAHSMGIPFIKLKLFKQGGIFETIQMAQIANQLGMKVVLGNGVASSLSNNVENWIFNYLDFFHGSSEANGFKKINKE